MNLISQGIMNPEGFYIIRIIHLENHIIRIIHLENHGRIESDRKFSICSLLAAFTA